MAATPNRKSSKRKPARNAPKTQVTVKGKGKIIVNRDFIMGDQTIHGGQYSMREMNIAKVSTPHEFVGQLRRVQGEIVALKNSNELTPAQVQQIEVVEDEVFKVIQEAKRPKPLPARINETLTTAKGTMDKIGGSLKSAVEVGATLGMLLQLAWKIFGS